MKQTDNLSRVDQITLLLSLRIFASLLMAETKLKRHGPAELPDVPTFYVNGYQVHASASEMTIEFSLTNENKVTLLLPYSLASLLSRGLKDVVDAYAKHLGVEVMPHDEIMKKLNELEKG